MMGGCHKYRWEVRLKNRWDVGFVRGGLSKQVGDGRLIPLPHTIHWFLKISIEKQ